MFTVNFLEISIAFVAIKTILTECNKKKIENRIKNRIELGHLNQYPAIMMCSLIILNL